MSNSKWKWMFGFFAVAALLWASGIAPQAYQTIMNAGVALTSRPTLNFTNAGCVDNSGSNRTDCTVGITQFSQTNSVTDAVQTTETTLAGTGSGSLVLAANFYKVGTVLKFEASGFYSTTATPGTITIRMKHTGGTTGTVVVGTTGAVTPLASITNGAWRLWGNITCRTTGTGGTFIINTIWEGDTSSVSSLTAGDASIVNTTTVTIDTTATQTVDLTTAWSAAGQTITNTNFLLYSPNNGPAPSSGSSFSAVPPYLTDSTNFFAPTFAITKPIPGNFTWQNQGGATNTTTANGAVYLLGTQQSGDQIRFWEEACPGSTPYTLTIGFIPQMTAPNFNAIGFGFQDSVSARAEFLVFLANNGMQLEVEQFTNLTTFSNHINSNGFMQGIQFAWFRISNTGTNLTFSWSTDGINFFQVFSDAVSGGFVNATPNRCGFMLDGNSTQTAAINAMTVLSLVQQ
jgi:hypothetical protein